MIHFVVKSFKLTWLCLPHYFCFTLNKEYSGSLSRMKHFASISTVGEGARALWWSQLPIYTMPVRHAPFHTDFKPYLSNTWSRKHPRKKSSIWVVRSSQDPKPKMCMHVPMCVGKHECLLSQLPPLLIFYKFAGKSLLLFTFIYSDYNFSHLWRSYWILFSSAFISLSIQFHPIYAKFILYWMSLFSFHRIVKHTCSNIRLL